MVDFHGGDYAEVMAATPVDIMEYANSYVLVIDMPGLQSGDIRAQVKADNVLLISAERQRVEKEGAKYVRMERRVGKFMRKFALPENANTDKITAVCRDGELTVTVEKLRPPEPKRPRTIQEAFGISREEECKVVAVDGISVLPNELLVSILCLLRFKEATATSILSRRWRYLHTLTTKLDFDGTYFLRRSKKCGYKNLDEERQKYVRWVDGVVGLHQSSRLEKFRVFFNLTQCHTHDIDEWVRFSLSRKVESLELHLTGEGEGSPEYCDCYTLNLDDFKLNSVNLMMMKKVSTYNVNVSGEAVEMLLRNCPLLEQVSIGESGDLLGVRIIEPYPSFKRLELVMCGNLSSIVVRDSNVVSVKYMGKTVKLVQLVNVPLLTEVWVGGMCTRRAEDVVAMFLSVLPQLHTFKIRFMKSYVLKRPRVHFCSKFCSAVEMTSLEQLVVDIGDFYDDRDSLLHLVDLIRASPLLQTFVIQAPHEKDHVDNFSDGESRKNIFPKIPMAYHHLKKVEFVGYRGVSSQFDMIMHLVENGAALETIVVDPWGFKTHCEASWDQIPRRKFNKQVFARANQLKECVPFGINVKIL